ncbi:MULTISPECIES: hypothetical protein [Pseudomonas]|jgi:hypothetical protein|uniref:Uncharacterized protein n=1 Tax=Pseudomonas salomonii TaxID=191391 RepID=A0A7Y8GB33_9PSED|nr:MULTISPECIES: hypothetical protein [Pseudomonas]NWF07127.1 hypothetical protein [Pseudomonas salomonii]
MDISKGIRLTTNMSRSIADLNLPRVKLPSYFAHALENVAEDLRKAEAVGRGEGRLVADNSPQNAVQTVVKNNQLVATIYKSGVVEISNQFAENLRNLRLPDSGTIRATMIAEAVGGEVLDVRSLSSQSRFSTTV